MRSDSGVKKLRERPPGSRVLVLIADGENTAGTIPPLVAAQLAAREGIRIYAIGVGSDQKEVPIVENGRLITRDDLGFDEAVMRRIAESQLVVPISQESKSVPGDHGRRGG